MTPNEKSVENQKEKSVREIRSGINKIRNAYDRRRVKFLISIIDQKEAALLSEREKVKRYREALEDLVLFSEARYNHLPIWIKAKEALNSPATEEGGA